MNRRLMIAQLICFITGTDTKVVWNITTKLVVFMEDVVLFCNTTLAEPCFGDTLLRWHGGHNMRLLTYNGSSTNDSKYISESSAGGFNLIIKHFDEKDIDVEYSCSFGFETERKILNMQENFELRPTNETVNTSCIFDDEHGLLVRGQLKKIHPKPECNTYIDELPVLKETSISHASQTSSLKHFVYNKLNISITSQKHFYAMEFEFQVNVEKGKCSVHLNISCLIGSKFYDILVTKLDRHCKVDNNGFNDICVIPIMAVILLPIVCGICCFVWYRQKRKNSLKKQTQKNVDNQEEEKVKTTIYDKNENNICNEMLKELINKN